MLRTQVYSLNKFQIYNIVLLNYSGCQGLGPGGHGKMVQSFSCAGWLSFGDLVYTLVTDLFVFLHSILCPLEKTFPSLAKPQSLLGSLIKIQKSLSPIPDQQNQNLWESGYPYILISFLGDSDQQAGLVTTAPLHFPWTQPSESKKWNEAESWGTWRTHCVSAPL